jgi:hypothetical protein
MARVGNGLPPERLLLVFEQGFAALWRRAHRTLGDVTLAAILDRVLRDGAVLHPVLAALQLRANGVSTEELRGMAASLRDDELVAALESVLVGFLAILGILTAEILTPALHAELEGLVPDEAGHGVQAGAPPNPESKDREP